MAADNWDDLNQDLLRFVGFFYAATIAVLFRVFVNVDYTSNAIQFAFLIRPSTMFLLSLIIWDFISTTFYIRAVKYNPPAYIEFVVHIFQVIALAFAVAFSVSDASMANNRMVWETAYFWVAVYCALMLVWNTAYFYRAEFVRKFFDLLKLEESSYEPFKVIAFTKGFFLPLVVVGPVVAFSAYPWPKAVPELEIFAVLYPVLRVIADIIAMKVCWSARARA